MCKPIINKVLDVFNGSIFTYGQTTSGKTHTMLGTAFDQGILNHSMKEIYAFILGNEDIREFTLWTTYMEIYNE